MNCPNCWVRKFWLQSTRNSCGKGPDPLPPLDEENAVDLEQISGTRPFLGRTNEPKTAFLGHFYRALRHAYISNSKTFKSVSVSASVTPPSQLKSVSVTQKATKLQISLQTTVIHYRPGLLIYRLGFWDSGGVPAIITNYMSEPTIKRRD